jgi:hypothetical protein
MEAIRTLKSNLIYIVMGIVILLALYLRNLPFQDTKLQDLKYILLIIIIVVAGFFYVAMQDKNQFQIDAAKPQPTKQFARQLTTSDYERIKRETTEREKQKLYESPAFKKMMNAKGNDESKWIWQTREKEKKTIYRDQEESDDESLSKVTITSDD